MITEMTHAREDGLVSAQSPASDTLKWVIRWVCRKWGKSEDHDAGLPYDEEIVVDGNLLTTAGLVRLLNLLIGTAATQAFDATHTRIGVGNGSTAAAVGDTDLSASAGSTNRWFQLVSGAGSVTTGPPTKVSFSATFGTSDGNFAWQEFTVDQGTASGNTVTAPMLNRKVQSLGTKVAGSTWTMTVEITLT